MTTLGCKINAFESALIGQSLEGQRWTVVDEVAGAECVIVNSCTVTAEADRQTRQAVRRAVRASPDALIVVTGCYAQMDPEACARIPGVDLVVGNDRKLDLHELLPPFERGELPKVLVGSPDEFVSLPSALLGGFEGHTRAFMQVQQGCDQGCTFCIIHKARGPARSLAPTFVRRQAERLILLGFRELVVCGVDLGSYGADLAIVDRGAGKVSGPDLESLLDILAGLPGDFRIRLSSIDPVHVTPGLIERLAASERLCPHIHLSMQSASTLILKRMKRRYDRELLYRRVTALREALPDLVLSADIMTGFPTESDEHFAETLAAVDDLGIAYPHVFPWSSRPGTPASRIPPARQVPLTVRKARAAKVREAGARIRRAVLAGHVGCRARVLVEGGGRPAPERRMARMANYLPVEVDAARFVDGDWAQVTIEHAGPVSLIAASPDPVG
jgi:threonylcarbamoyladenosine tRNA methylthiotransferase MtaB